MSLSPVNLIPTREDLQRIQQLGGGFSLNGIFRDPNSPGVLFWVDEADGNEYTISGGTGSSPEILLAAGPPSAAPPAGARLYIDQTNQAMHTNVAGTWTALSSGGTTEVVTGTTDAFFTGAAPAGAVFGINTANDKTFKVVAGNWSAHSTTGTPDDDFVLSAVDLTGPAGTAEYGINTVTKQRFFANAAGNWEAVPLHDEFVRSPTDLSGPAGDAESGINFNTGQRFFRDASGNWAADSSPTVLAPFLQMPIAPDAERPNTPVPGDMVPALTEWGVDRLIFREVANGIRQWFRTVSTTTSMLVAEELPGADRPLTSLPGNLGWAVGDHFAFKNSSTTPATMEFFEWYDNAGTLTSRKLKGSDGGGFERVANKAARAAGQTDGFRSKTDSNGVTYVVRAGAYEVEDNNGNFTNAAAIAAAVTADEFEPGQTVRNLTTGEEFEWLDKGTGFALFAKEGTSGATAKTWQGIVATANTAIDFAAGAGVRISGASTATTIATPTNPAGVSDGVMKIQGSAVNPITSTQLPDWDLGGRTFTAPASATLCVVIPFFYDSIGDVWHADLNASYVGSWGNVAPPPGTLSASGTATDTDPGISIAATATPATGETITLVRYTFTNFASITRSDIVVEIAGTMATGVGGATVTDADGLVVVGSFAGSMGALVLANDAAANIVGSFDIILHVEDSGGNSFDVTL